MMIYLFSGHLEVEIIKLIAETINLKNNLTNINLISLC